MTQVRALVVSGYGINCEREMQVAAERAGAQAEICHLHDLLEEQGKLDHVQLLLLPGGFSFGDELGGGKVFSNRMLTGGLRGRLQSFVNGGGCILGICNGFQILLKLGLLPGCGTPAASLTANDSGRFENRWSQHKVLPSPCIFTKGLQQLYLPLRHGEGKFVITDADLRCQLFARCQVVLQYADSSGEAAQSYPENPNGSDAAIAGICDPTGRILGMMAHPEAFIHQRQHPHWTRRPDQDGIGDGLHLFQNAVNYIQEHFHETHTDRDSVTLQEEGRANLCQSPANS